MQLGLGWYLSGPADFTKVYGSASAIFAFLFSVYLSASPFVLGAILTAVLDEQLRTAKEALSDEPRGASPAANGVS